MDRAFEKMRKILVVLTVPAAIFFLAWLIWPQKMISTVPPRLPEVRSSVSFSAIHQEITSPPELSSKIEFRPETMSPPQNPGRNFEVPQGAVLPVVLMDNGSSETNKIADELLISLEEEFFTEWDVAKSKGVASQEVWEELRSKYDEKYIALFGQEAYLEATSVAADEAREDYEAPAKPR